MTVNKRSKNVRQRGTKTHGWGSMKKHRGAGSRGGRGMAGTGKRGDAKKPSIWKDKNYFGRHGFNPHTSVTLTTMNAAVLCGKVETLLAEKKIQKEQDVYVINLEKLKINKLLAKGTITKKLDITVEYATPKAIEKVQAAGGKITLLSSVEDEPQKKEEKQEPPKAVETPKEVKKEEPEKKPEVSKPTVESAEKPKEA